MIKKYNQSEVQICGECTGEGKIWQQTEPARHGSSDYEVGHFKTCTTCNGAGRVKVTKDITVTIEPHIQRPNQN